MSPVCCARKTDANNDACAIPYQSRSLYIVSRVNHAYVSVGGVFNYIYFLCIRHYKEHTTHDNVHILNFNLVQLLIDGVEYKFISLTFSSR